MSEAGEQELEVDQEELDKTRNLKHDGTEMKVGAEVDSRDQPLDSEDLEDGVIVLEGDD